MVSVARRVALVSLAGAFTLVTFLQPVVAQRKDDQADKKQQERLQRARSQELQPLVKLVDGVMAGSEVAMPAEFAVSFHQDFLKATDQKTYVPFTLTIPKSGVTANALAMYLRVAPKGATGAAAGEQRDEKRPTEPRFPFEDVHFIELRTSDDAYRVSRAFAVIAGDYDVYVALRERNKKEGAKTTILKQELAVPDFWSNELTTSSMILTDEMNPLQQPLSADQQVERPYALGSVEIVPAEDSAFDKAGVLSVFFLIYNPTLGPDRKPSIQVDYNFYERLGETDKYFNKTSPQEFNAQTLPPEFDLDAGHQLVAGQSVPLSAFKEGEWRLEVKITDKMSGRTLTRNVNFTVQPS